MAIFRKGVKVAGQDIRVGLGKGRAQDWLRKKGILEDDKGRKKYEKDSRGEIQMIRTAVGQSEGFLHPSNFKVVFNPPRGIQQPSWDATKRDGTESKLRVRLNKPKGDWVGDNAGAVKGGTLDWKTHKMNYSTTELILEKYKEAAKVARTLWNPKENNMAEDGPRGEPYRIGDERTDSTLNLYWCILG